MSKICPFTGDTVEIWRARRWVTGETRMQPRLVIGEGQQDVGTPVGFLLSKARRTEKCDHNSNATTQENHACPLTDSFRSTHKFVSLLSAERHAPADG